MRKLYGASPLHLLGHVILLAASVLALSQMLQGRSVWIWLLGAVVLHDIVLVPAYSGLDRVLQLGVRDRPARRVPLVNHIRVPLAFSGLLLLVYLPAILGDNTAQLERVSGRDAAPSVLYWAALTAGAFLVSGLVWIVRMSRTASTSASDPT